MLKLETVGDAPPGPTGERTDTPSNNQHKVSAADAEQAAVAAERKAMWRDLAIALVAGGIVAIATGWFSRKKS